MTRPNVRIIVATHKDYRMPEDPMYLPLHVGAAIHDFDLDFARDDTGDNISDLNLSFCELTGLYWAWKHLDADYLGMVHYRRYFTVHLNAGTDFDAVLQEPELQDILQTAKVVIPRKRYYFIETLYSHYEHTHYAEQLDMVRSILVDYYPDYLKSYDRVVSEKSGHMFNMMIMRRDLFQRYCAWLFDILFKLKDRLPPELEELTGFQGRFYGRVSEIIFNVWLDYQLEHALLKWSDVRELPVMVMERTNWPKKVAAFLAAKFFGRKYEQSF
ncbi:MAG: DUF4422 domain-containing protein [Clostridia bacterium]|nr:DUF4422 domain-containing protein [Clostridia bacterium]